MKRTTLKRKQPRRMTPPLVLRDESDGSRHIIEVDDQITIAQRCVSLRTVAFLTFAPGLTVQVKSRCVNKRRVMSLSIAAVNMPVAGNVPALCADSSLFRSVKSRAESGDGPAGK